MEEQIIVSNHNQNTPLSSKEVEIAKIVWNINQLVSYPLSDHQIESWSKSINELYPNLDLDILKQVIIDMKLDKIDWDTKKGIQNITSALTSMGIDDFYTEQFRQKYLTQPDTLTNK